MSEPHTLRAFHRYEVEVTVRETFTMVVEAVSAADARGAVRDPNRRLVESWPHSDRQITGIKAVRRAVD